LYSKLFICTWTNLAWLNSTKISGKFAGKSTDFSAFSLVTRIWNVANPGFVEIFRRVLKTKVRIFPGFKKRKNVEKSNVFK